MGHIFTGTLILKISNSVTFKVIQIYVPTSASIEEALDEFNDIIEEVLTVEKVNHYWLATSFSMLGKDNTVENGLIDFACGHDQKNKKHTIKSVLIRDGHVNRSFRQR